MSLTRPIKGTLSGIRKRRKHFLRKRKFAYEFAKSDLHDVARQLYDCQETEVLACCSACGKSWYIIDRCRLRVCPLCSYEVSKQRGDYLKAMTRNMTHPKMLTLTQPLWQRDPHDGIKYLRSCFNKLRRNTLFKDVKGGAYQIELKEKEQGWHIHMHVLLDCPYIPYQRLFTEWKKILGTTAPQIQIQAASSPRAREYVCKYAAKSADFDTNTKSIVRWYLATKGERLFATFGAWYNAKIEELDNEKEKPESVSVCPHCGSHKTTFLARDGPWVYGLEDWREIEAGIVGSKPESREIEGAEQEITDPERPEEKEERLRKKAESSKKQSTSQASGPSTF